MAEENQTIYRQHSALQKLKTET